MKPMKILFFLLATLTLFGKETHPIITINQWCKEEKGLTEGRYFTFGTLASVSSSGRPHTRMIEVSHFDKDKGVLFFTHKNTRKVSDFQFNPYASLNLWLPKTHRQITLEGKVEEISIIEAEKSWNRLPRFMKLSFLASNHTGKLESDEILEKRKGALKEAFPKEIPMPPTFIGYRLIPLEVIFFQLNHRSFPKKEIATLEDRGWITVLSEP